MAPRIQERPEPRRAAQKSKPARRKKKHRCGDCGRICKSPAGLAAHRRAAHPPSVEAVPEPSEPMVVVRDVPPAPDGLAVRAKDLWESVVGVYDLRPDELRILEDACREAMLVDRLDRELDGAPLLVKGSMGQLVANPLVQELRQHRSTFAGLMAKLQLPDDPDQVSADSPAERTVKARAAANARWRRGS